MSLSNPDVPITKQDLADFYQKILPYLGASAEDIEDLLDVNITTPSNGQVLKYDSTSSKWVNGAASSGGHTIQDSTGTALTQRATMQVNSPLTATDDSSNSKTLIGVDTNASLSGITPPSIQPEGINTHYALSSTSASTASKEATSYDGSFSLAIGTKVNVLFDYANTASSPTLSIDSSTAKPIKGFGTDVPSSWWKAGDIVSFIYNGTNWIMQPTQGQITEISNNLSDKADDSYVKANTFGTTVALSNNVQYICPSDGYVRGSAQRTTGNYCVCTAQDANGNVFNLFIITAVSGTAAYDPSYTVFVRKGTKITMSWNNTSGSGMFVPLE